MKYFSLTSFIVLILLFGCKNTQGDIPNMNKNKYSSNYTIEREILREFRLDDETSYLINYFQIIDEGAPILAFTNSYNNSIYFYDYENQEYIKKIKYEKEGQNGVSSMQAFLYLNDDSIFVYSYNTNILSLTNSDAKVLNNYMLYEAPLEMPEIINPSPYVQTSTPLKKIGDYIVCMGFISGETSYETTSNRPVACIVDLNDETIKNMINYPKQYTKYNWGGGFTYRMPYYDVNNNGEIVVSFAAEHDIHVYSILNSTENNYYAGSNKIDKISSFDQPKDTPIDEDKAWYWYMTNASYENVLYDKYNNLYYRIARLPLNNFKIKEVGNKKPIRVIILDENLNYKGEVGLDENKPFTLNNSFVTKEGLNIQVRTDDDDKLTFYVYSFKES